MAFQSQNIGRQLDFSHRMRVDGAGRGFGETQEASRGRGLSRAQIGGTPFLGAATPECQARRSCLVLGFLDALSTKSVRDVRGREYTWRSSSAPAKSPIRSGVM